MDLKNIVPWGRSFEEYRKIFSLTDATLQKTILGCGDGPASFNAELSARGGNIISIDPVYQFDATSLKSRIEEAYDEVMHQMEANKEQYIWDSIPSVEALGETRMAAMEHFILDYEKGKAAGRYRDESLPKLSFSDDQFDLALSSHYLFLYSEHVSLQEHIASIKELCRVALEVRIYPLLALNGAISPHLQKVIQMLEESGFTPSLEDIDYQFQRGATQMLVIRRQS